MRIRPLLLGAALAAAAPLAAAMPAEAQERPNILVLETDDQTLESMAVMPRVRELIGERGTTFTRSFANYALCCPSRATLYTGQYAHNHGVLSNMAPNGGYARLDKSNWLPLWLQAAGYRTMHVGKFLNGYGAGLTPPTEVPPGFEDWHGTVDPTTYRFYNYTVNENGTLMTYGAAGEQDFYSTDFFTRRANELIRAAAPSNRPFFMSVAYLAPHTGGPREDDDPANLNTTAVAPRHKNALSSTPLPLPPSFNEADVSDKPAGIQSRRVLGPNRVNGLREGYQQRLESLLAVDEGVASILSTLRAVRELDDTLVIFTSDNGFFHGEHRVLTGKVLLYEPSVRLPLLMRGPGVPAGERRGQLVTNADLAPTILDAANARAGRVQDGRSLFGLLDDPRAEWGRELLLTGGDNQGLRFSGLRNYRFKYVEHATGEVELYDLERDPHELFSLHGDPALASLRGQFHARLAALRACAGRSCRARPALRLQTRRRCPRTRVLARVRGPERALVDRVEFQRRRRGTSAFRRLARDSRSPFARRLRPRNLRPGRRFLLRARVALSDGRSVTLDRRVRACR
jgi:arylsulfatase A-like enzyme